MKFFRIAVLCAVMAAAGYLAADDGGMGNGNLAGGGMGNGHLTGDDGGGAAGSGNVASPYMGSGNIVSLDDGGLVGSGGGKDDGGGTMGTGTLTEYQDETGARFLIVAFDDGSWFVFGMP